MEPVQHPFAQFEEVVNRTLTSISRQNPEIFAYVFCGCRKCGTENAIFPVFDGQSGFPSTRFGVTIFTIGDRTSKFLNGGSLPTDSEIHDEGNGCFVTTLMFSPSRCLPEDVGAQLIELASKLSRYQAQAAVTV
jgi:hypothetical protein